MSLLWVKLQFASGVDVSKMEVKILKMMSVLDVPVDQLSEKNKMTKQKKIIMCSR